MQKKQIEQEYLSPDECGVISGESPWTWRRRAYRGEIASVKFGKRLLIPVTEFKRLAARGTSPRVKEE